MPGAELVRIATRKSRLAVRQAETVARQLQDLHPRLKIELVGMITQGDRVLDSPLARIGGKGLFVKELEEGLLTGGADLAVHSMKDVPIAFPSNLHLPVILHREDPRDALVSNRFESLTALPCNARIGTSSLRRQCQIKYLLHGARIHELRGNVNTRLAKLDAGDFDAIILAAAGLKRLGLEDRIRECISIESSLPAIGQGAIGIECRCDDARINDLIAPLDDRATHIRVRAERAINARLNGGCQVPIAGFAELSDGELCVRGLIGYPDGRKIIRGQARGVGADAESLGRQVAEDLLTQGAGEILAALGMEVPVNHQ